MKGIGIAVLLMLGSIGCATPYARQWQPQLWQDSEKSTQMPEIGRLETQTLALGIIVTQFQERLGQAQPFIGVSVSSRNETQGTIQMESNPIQVVDATNVLVKPLALDHMMYQLYGGKLREGAQLTRLAENSKPLVSSGASILEDVLVAVVNTYRAQERGAIITEFHHKEALPYDLYYHSFNPTSLPPGVATTWTEYYPHTTEMITVMLQGQRVEDGISFVPPPESQPPESQPPEPQPSNHFLSPNTAGTIVGVIFLIPLTAFIIANVGK